MADEPKKPDEESPHVELRDLKPSRDVKGGARKEEASFLLADDDESDAAKDEGQA